MPKDEFDFEDPLELNGVSFVTEEDTTDAMCECFIEEFMRMGYGHKQVLAFFRNPHYLGMNMALEKRGEPFVRKRISEVFARWGRPIQQEWTESKQDGTAAATTDCSAPTYDPNNLTDPMGAPLPSINL